jgi:hypothetical protein
VFTPVPGLDQPSSLKCGHRAIDGLSEILPCPLDTWTAITIQPIDRRLREWAVSHMSNTASRMFVGGAVRGVRVVFAAISTKRPISLVIRCEFLKYPGAARADAVFTKPIEWDVLVRALGTATAA